MQLYSMLLATGVAKRNGMIRDERGRLVDSAYAICVGGDGNIYVNATVYPFPGDRRYSYRLFGQYYYPFDTCLLQIRPTDLH